MIMEQNENIQPDLAQQIAEAEERGYRRGLNEQIDSKMKAPGVWEGPEGSEPETPDEFKILGNRRRSIWDLE